MTSSVRVPGSVFGDQGVSRSAYLWRAAAVRVRLGGLLFGYDWVVIGGAKAVLRTILFSSTHVHWRDWAMSLRLDRLFLARRQSVRVRQATASGRKPQLIFALALTFPRLIVGNGACI